MKIKCAPLFKVGIILLAVSILNAIGMYTGNTKLLNFSNELAFWFIGAFCGGGAACLGLSFKVKKDE